MTCILGTASRHLVPTSVQFYVHGSHSRVVTRRDATVARCDGHRNLFSVTFSCLLALLKSPSTVFKSGRVQTLLPGVRGEGNRECDR